MEEEFVANQERLKPQEERNEEDRSKVVSIATYTVSIAKDMVYSLRLMNCQSVLTRPFTGSECLLGG